ncbi:PAS domain-containing protein [Methylobacterium sp. NMS12]|uniref:PAS domain-containing protein n=1 Tax=Methylobacterium sp. NMS12 TaxID=3079766 RepID=UPI003F884D9F
MYAAIIVIQAGIAQVLTQVGTANGVKRGLPVVSSSFAVQAALPDCLKAAGVVGAWTHDTATGLVVADSGVGRLFGIPEPDPLNGDPLERYAEAIHPGDRANFATSVAKACRNGTSIALQYRVRTSGGVNFVHDYGMFTLDAAGRPLRGQGIVIDTTRVRHDVEAFQELAVDGPPSVSMERQITELAEHVIAASEIARALPSTRLRVLTDPLLWEVGRLLAWATTKHSR